MAKRIDLRAYQESIASRLAAAEAGAAVPALLGFESAGRRWLIELPAAGEVLPLPPITPVPLTQAWLLGLANVHGELVGVVDFARFCGAAPTPLSATCRLLRIGVRQGVDSALLVGRVFGLKRTDSLFAAEAALAEAALPWQADMLADSQGEHWRRLDVARLIDDPCFLDARLLD